MLNGKVDKVTGKGLSTNDYTDSEKSKVATIDNKVDKSDVISDMTTIGSNVNKLVSALAIHDAINNSITSLSKAISNELNKKINISDIQDNLTSTDTNKPLSANQGNILKNVIDNKMSLPFSGVSYENLKAAVGAWSSLKYAIETYCSSHWSISDFWGRSKSWLFLYIDENERRQLFYVQGQVENGTLVSCVAEKLTTEIVVDSVLNYKSKNPVQNSAIYSAIAGIQSTDVYLLNNGDLIALPWSVEYIRIAMDSKALLSVECSPYDDFSIIYYPPVDIFDAETDKYLCTVTEPANSKYFSELQNSSKIYAKLGNIKSNTLDVIKIENPYLTLVNYRNSNNVISQTGRRTDGFCVNLVGASTDVERTVTIRQTGGGLLVLAVSQVV